MNLIRPVSYKHQFACWRHPKPISALLSVASVPCRYQEQPGLHHIKMSALKDRARSRRFQRIMERAELDRSLLERPDALCGKLDKPELAEDDLTRSSRARLEGKPPTDSGEVMLPPLPDYSFWTTSD